MWRYKYLLKKQNGFTLIESLIVLAIIILIIGISYEYFYSNSKHTKNELHEAYIRSDFRLAQKFLMDDIRYFNGELSVGGSNLTLGNVTYSIVNNKLTRTKNGSTLVFNDIYNVEFNLENSNLIRINFNENDHKFAVAIWSYITSNNPDDTSDFSYFIQDQDVFVYGTDLAVSGSASVKGENSTVVVLKSGSGPHIFYGNNDIYISRLFIDNSVIFTDSTDIGEKIGDEYKTDVIYITESVIINNGGVDINSQNVFIDGNLTDNNGASIDCDTIYIKGNLTLNNGSSYIKAKNIFTDGNVVFDRGAHIECDNIYIKGNLLFQNWTDKLDCFLYYVGGSISKTTNKPLTGSDGHIMGERVTDPESVPEPVTAPEFPNFSMENTLRTVEWYNQKGYAKPSQLSDNIKIFSEGDCTYSTIGKINTFNNITIISTGDITLTNYMYVNYGFLFAPFGKVTFEGASFKGIVIARDGFIVTNGNAKIEFKTLEECFESTGDYPFQ